MRQRPPQPPSIVESLGQVLGLAQSVEDPALLGEHMKGVAKLQADVDAPLPRLPGLGQVGERQQSLLETGGRFPVSGAGERHHPGLMEILGGFIPELPMEAVAADHRRVRLPVGAGHLSLGPDERASDLRVEVVPLVPRQRPVGHLLRERVPEGLLGIGTRPRLPHEVGRLELPQARLQRRRIVQDNGL